MRTTSVRISPTTVTPIVRGNEPVAKTTLIGNVEVYLKKRFDFRFNTIKGRVEYKAKHERDFILLNDFDTNSIHRELLKQGFRIHGTTLRSLLYSDFSPKFNPFETYLNSLPEWNETTDYISQLANTVHTTNQELWLKVFRKWIVAMVGSLLDEETINHTVIVFRGKQGVGKTSWFLKLVPKELSDYCYSGAINPNNKDTLIMLAECMLINLDELETLSRTEVGSLKEIITKDSINVRRPYGHYNENLARRASLVGSVNNKEFLNDTTGSRRFLCFEVDEIDYAHKINIGKVLAQALWLYRTGKFKYWFDKDEINEVVSNNEEFQLVTMEEEALLQYFEATVEKDSALMMSTTEICAALSVRTNMKMANYSIGKLGKALAKYGFSKVTRKDRRVYLLKEKGK